MVKIMQCWDDGVVSDLRLMELLRKYQAKATFNLNPGFNAEQRGVARWAPKGYAGWSCRGFIDGKLGKNELREVYSEFQVASHCMRHEGAGLVPDAEFVRAALEARHYLEDLFQRPCRGFAWPGGLYTQTTADALLAAGFAYGRTVEASDHVAPCKQPMVLRPSCHFMDPDFYQRYAKAKSENGIFYFWGHSYEMLDSEGLWGQMERKLQYLSEDPDAVWCDVIDIDWAGGNR